MKFQKNSLSVKIWLYLIFFCILILVFLWLFQVIFLKSYYEWSKTKDMDKIAKQVVQLYQNDTAYTDQFDQLSFSKNVCIEVITDKELTYSSNAFHRGCLDSKNQNFQFQSDQQTFMNGTEDKKSFRLRNPRFQNMTLVYGIRLNDQVFAFIHTSLDPMDSTIIILKDQLLYVTVGVLLLSFVIAYFISKKISLPIVKISKSAKKMAKGEYDVVFETGTDIEEMNELADTLNYARDELGKTEELRRDLMANVSHDLKTPLTMIKAYAEMVRDLSFQDPVKREAHLNVIIEETDRLTYLVNDILDLSSMQSHIDSLQLEVFSLPELIETIIKRYDILVEKEEYQFVFEKKEELYVEADKKKMEQVIYNLINNAIQYTGKDNMVKVVLTKKETTVLIEIIDHGKGIDSKDLPYIWDKYYKNKKKHKRNAVGTGLGLSIVKAILENHKVLYGVSSKLRKGTTFYFELPLKKRS